jgi:hypothetical protein
MFQQGYYATFLSVWSVASESVLFSDEKIYFFIELSFLQAGDVNVIFPEKCVELQFLAVHTFCIPLHYFQRVFCLALGSTIPGLSLVPRFAKSPVDWIDPFAVKCRCRPCLALVHEGDTIPIFLSASFFMESFMVACMRFLILPYCIFHTSVGAVDITPTSLGATPPWQGVCDFA